MRLRASLNSMALLPKPNNSSALPNSKSVCADTVRMGNIIGYSATTRGVLGTVLTVGIYFSLFPVPGLRALGFSLLTMNFIESILETRKVNLEVEELRSSLSPT